MDYSSFCDCFYVSCNDINKGRSTISNERFTICFKDIDDGLKMPASPDAILTDALKAEEWLEKNRLRLKGKVYRPVALARVFAGNDRVREILEH